MKLLRLDLLAFGPFTGGKLDFAKKPDALQIVYGPNEAGKSTTLRALLALLYGIPLRTSDAHLHDMARLRVGALLEDHRGRILSLTRRKGAKHTLLDAEGKPLPDNILSDLLLGIDEPMFRQMFGLDHQRLREGGEALLAGGGNLGEGLFDASVGTRALREVKEALRLEAEALYKARGKTPKLNVALDSLREKMREKREKALSPSTYVEQTKALSLAKQRREQCLAARRAVLAERTKLERELRLLPLLARHAQLGAELGALQGGRPAQVEALAAKTLSEAELRDLERRYGAALSFSAELPRSQAELGALERELAGLRARLGPAVAVEKTIDTPLRTRWRKLAEELSAAQRRAGELSQDRALVAIERAQLEVRLRALAAEPVHPALAVLVESAAHDEQIAARARLQGELERQETACQRGLLQLGVEWARELSPRAVCERLSLARLPGEQELAAFEQRELELERALSERRKEERAARERIHDLERRMRALLEGGDLSTEADLRAARAERARAFSQLASELSETALRRFEVELLRSDAVSDKLLREALRSADHARLSHDLLELRREAEARQAEASALAERERALCAELGAALQDCGLAREPVRALRAKLLKFGALREAASEALSLRARHESAQRRSAELAEALCSQLGRDPAAVSLDSALAEARARIEQSAAGQRERAGLTQRCAELELRLAAIDQQLSESETRKSDASARLSAELAAAGFPAELGHEEALACLDDLALYAEAQRRHAALCERLSSAAAQRDQLELDVRAAVQRFALASGAASLGEQLALLTDAERRQRESRRDAERLKQELGASERELTELGDGADLNTLRALTQGLDPNVMRARLVELETEAAQLDEEIGSLDQTLGRLEAGLSNMSEADHAVPVAEEVEAELANVRALTRRYLEVRLSLSLLSREVERHRAQHQGPLLSRASALFSALTLGRYAGLSVELDERDEPLLSAQQTGGKIVRVAGLSDGTRDQLYLSLRIASIERFLSASPALPLVLDDAFIHFDDARAEAALLALAELSKRTQVLFFTHHARMVELAKRALKPAQIALHELDPARGTVAFRDNGPLFAGA